MSALVQHSTLPDAVKHHPKGADTAAAGTVYVADGAGGGVFGPVPAPAAGSVDHGTLGGLTDDDHTQYLTETRHDNLPSDNPHSVTAAQVGADPQGSAATAQANALAALSAHVADPDPHGQYLLETALDAAIATFLDRHHQAQDTAANNNTITPVSYMTGSFTLQHSASYRVMANYIWSLNSAGTDILVELRIDGTTVGIPQRHEPQDTAGAGPFGTDQRYPASLMELIFLPAGAHTFELFFAGSTINDNAALYRGDIFVERYL